MSHPDEPDDPGAAPPHEGGHEHHTLREEIAEVVEHVPQPVRWTIGKLVRLTLLSLFALIVLMVVSVALYLANRTQWVAQEIALVVNQTLARHSDVYLAMKDIRGNPLSGFRVMSPSVRFRGGGAPPLLEAGSLRIGYSLWGVVTGASRSIDIEIEHPVIRLVNRADGSLRLPKWVSESGGKGGEGLRFHVKLHEMELAMPDSNLDLHHAEFDGVALTSPARVDIAQLSWASGPYLTRLDGLRAHAEFGDSVRVQLSELRSPELLMSANASWLAKGGPKQVAADIRLVRWPLLARVFDNQSLNVPGVGSVQLEASGDRNWQGRFHAVVDWDSLRGSGGGDFRFAGGQLSLAPLQFDSPAGKLRGRLAWAHKGWELAGEVAEGNPARWGPIHLSGWPEGRLFGFFRYVEDTRPHGSSRIEARLAASQLAGWRADSATVVIDIPESLPDSFTVNVLRRGGHMRLHGRTTGNGWKGDYDLSRYALEEWEDGHKSGLSGILGTGSGTVEDREDGLFVTGNLRGEQVDWLGIHAWRCQLPDFRGRLLPTPALETRVDLTDAMYLGLHFDSVRAGIHIGDASVGLDSIRGFASDSVITTGGLVAYGAKGWKVTLDRARATSSQFDWTAEAPLELHGDAENVWFDRVAAREGDSRVTFSGRWAQKGGTYDWTGSGRNLDLARLGLPREWDLSGSFNTDLEITGRSGDPRWRMQVAARAPATRGHALDSLAFELEGAPARIELLKARCAMRGGTLEAHGAASGMARDWPDTLVSDAITRWIATAHDWHGAAEVHAFPLDRLVALFPDAEGTGGTLSANLQFGGRPDRPTAEVTATVEPAVWKSYRADQIAVRATLGDARLRVAELKVTRKDLASRIHGEMPLDLALGRNARIPDEPMQWTIEAPSGDLTVLPQFVPQVGFAAGRFDVHATIAGTPRHPQIDGTARIRDGRVRLAAREEVLEKLTADFRIQSSAVILDSLVARQGARGSVRGHGRVDLDGFALRGYRFDLALRNFAASEPGLYAALFDGDFVVTNGPRVAGQTLPRVEGRASIRQAAILFDFSNQSEVQQIAAATQPLFWTYDIQLEANDRLSWRPPEGDIEFNADLRLVQSRDSLLIYGEMHALRGTYWFLSNKFDIQSVDLTFDNVEGSNPVIDAIAITRVSPSVDAPSGTTPDTSPHEITAHIKGRANKPVIDFSDADPHNPWDQSAILRELTYGRFRPGSAVAGAGGLAGIPAVDPLDNYVTRAINRSLSADLSKAFGGYINEWSLERDNGGLINGSGEVMVSAASQVTNKLSLRYSQRLPGLAIREVGPTTTTGTNLFEREVRAEYRLSRFFYVTTDIAQRRSTSVTTSSPSTGPDYNVNLKARWEY